MHRQREQRLTILRERRPKAGKQPVSHGQASRVGWSKTKSTKRSAVHDVPEPYGDSVLESSRGSFEAYPGNDLPVAVRTGPCEEHTGRYHAQDSRPLFQTDIIAEIIGCCPANEFIFLAGVSKTWRSAWTATGRATTTSVRLAASTHSRTAWALGEPTFMRASADAGGLFCLTAAAGNLKGLQAAANAFGRGWIHDDSSSEVTQRAAEGGHLDVLEWATDQGCNLNETICGVAAKRGHLDILEWVRSRGFALDETTCRSAAEGGQLDVLKWARSHGCPWNRLTCSSAARGGHLGLLQWARSQRCPWDASTCSSAAAGGHLEVLKWARTAGCPWDSGTCSAAAEGGHLDVLKWARSQQCPWNAFTCGHAAMWGHLDMLKWAWSQGCPWSPSACSWAAGRGHLDVLKWANEQGCPWNKSFCAGCARSKGHQEVVDWIREQQQQEG